MEGAMGENSFSISRRGEKFKGEEKRILVQSVNEVVENELGNGIPDEVVRRYIRTEFHLVDLKHDKIDCQCLPSVLQFVVSSSMVALDHFVYIFGSLSPSMVKSAAFKLLQSQSPESDQKFFLGGSRLDLDLDPSQGRVWCPAPVPIQNRTFPRCTSLLGKIYAFGTSYLAPEVLDLTVGHWKPLCLVPPQLVGCSVSLFALPDPSNNCILLHLSGGQLSSPSLYAFSPPADVDGTHSSGGTWKCLAFNFLGWTHVAAVVDDVIYFHSHKYPSILLAFDLASETWLKVHWASSFNKNVDMNDKRMDFDALFSFGDSILCLAVWSHIYDFDDKPHIDTKIYFPKFRVKRSGATISLIPISAHSYVLPRTSSVLHSLFRHICISPSLIHLIVLLYLFFLFEFYIPSRIFTIYVTYTDVNSCIWPLKIKAKLSVIHSLSSKMQ